MLGIKTGIAERRSAPFRLQAVAHNIVGEPLRQCLRGGVWKPCPLDNLRAVDLPALDPIPVQLSPARWPYVGEAALERR